MRPTMTRRQVLRASGGAVLGVTGAIALAACGETQIVTVEKIVTKEVPVETIVTKEVAVEKVVTREVIKEVMAQRQAVKIELHHDHTSGPRGAAMRWALERFEQTNPNILIRFVPQTDDFFDVFAIKIAAGTNGEVALLTGYFMAQWLPAGDAFTQINEPLQKNPKWDPSAVWHTPDEHGLVFWNRVPSPHLDPVFGPLWGLPYQGNISGYGYNFDIMESAGIEFPSAGSWGLETEYLDALTKATDPEDGQWGMRMRGAHHQFVSFWPVALADRDDLMSYMNEDGTHYECLDDGGVRGLQLCVDMIHKHKVSFAQEAAKEISGEFGSPFRAGKVLVDLMGGATGYNVAAIKDRFRWGLGPTPEGRYGPVPSIFGGQAHLVSGNAEKLGTVEESVEVVLFFAGEEVQTRVAVDRGSFPMYKNVLDSPEFAAAPPENHTHWKTIVNSTGHRHGQSSHPARVEIIQAAGWDTMINGEETVEEGVPKLIAAKDRVLANELHRYDALKTWVGTLSS